MYDIRKDRSGTSRIEINDQARRGTQIRSERFATMSKKQITLTDIAEICGTSNVTVSKALAGKRGMSDELREKILSTADKLGYIPNRSSINGGVIGVLIPERFINPNGSFYWALYNSIVQRLKSENFSCIQEILAPSEEEALIMPSFPGGQNIAGLISLGQTSNEYAHKLAEQDKPLLMLDYYIEGMDVDSVVTNGFFGGYKLTCHLIAQGHKRIGYVGTRLATSSIFDRYMGYMKAMLEHGLTTDDKWVIDDRDVHNELYEALPFPKEMPTAFVCNCDETAFKAIRDLKALGYSVPEDISIVGYDNYLISEISEPPITTINVDSKEMADLAVSTLIDRIRNSKLPTRIQILDGKLIEKASVRKIN